MTYEMLLFLFIAVVLTYLTLVGILLHRELSEEAREKEAREKHAREQKTLRLPSDLEYFSARFLGRERMLKILPMAVRYHFERLRPQPADTESQLQNQGCLSVKPLRHRIADGRWKAYRQAHLQEKVRYHFYKLFPPQQTEHKTLDSAAYGELEEQVRFHFYRLLPTLEMEHESVG
jgi:hypothetical protein